MRHLRLIPALLLAAVLSLQTAGDVAAQTQPISPVTVGSAMPDFTLPVFQGGEVTLSELRGKNVMIVFPRGLSRPGSWCHICPYQHAEFVEYEAETDWQSRANLEILYVLPYSKEMIGEWIDAY
ncbi:MAG: peroxiredoxin family protein, partial [Longimicrobiales bacterium]|nr:peroxiredoxin family protein [Longimicrobiales bacterium]